MLTNTTVIVINADILFELTNKRYRFFYLDTLLFFKIQNVIYIENKVHSNEEMRSVDK